MSCFICKRKKKPAPEPVRAPHKAAPEPARAPPRAAPAPAREPPQAAPEPPPPRREEVGPSNGRNQWADGHMDETDRRMSGLTRNMEIPTSTSYTYWNNYRDDDAHSFVHKIFYEDPNPRLPKQIPRSQFQQDYDIPETLMSSAETYYDYGCVGAPSFDPPPYRHSYGSGY